MDIRPTRVIIPVRNEAGNIRRMVEEITTHAPSMGIYFVDDSDGYDTLAQIEAVRDNFSDHEIGWLYRTPSERYGKIVGAVRESLIMARLAGVDRVIVMDGDGQHDPRYLAQIERRLHVTDVVVGSRYAPGGSHEGLNGSLRVLGSKGATKLAAGLFPQQLRSLKDPMSGYFGLNLDMIDVDAIEADGFKVLLAIMLTHPGLTRSEVPVVFRDRFSGVSKMNLAIAAEYVSQLMNRRFAPPTRTVLVRREVATR